MERNFVEETRRILADNLLQAQTALQALDLQCTATHALLQEHFRAFRETLREFCARRVSVRVEADIDMRSNLTRLGGADKLEAETGAKISKVAWSQVL